MRTRPVKVNVLTASPSFSSPRGNMSPYQNELTSFGARTVPPFKRQSSSFHGSRKKTKSELPSYKFFTLSDVETEQQDPKDIYDVPAGLNKLQRKSMNFTVCYIQEELDFQLGQHL